MNKYLISFGLLAIYAITILYPYYLTTIAQQYDSKIWWNVLHSGFVHIPSILYVVSSALLLHLTLKFNLEELFSSHKKTHKEIQEAIKLLSIKQDNFSSLLDSTNPFVIDIKEIILHGAMEEDIELVVEKRVSDLTTRYEKLLSEYGYIATILPMLGMLGTITGLLQMFAVSDGIDNIAEKMASLSVALATTLYATMWVILITKPKAREIEISAIELENIEHKLIMSAKLFLHNADLNLLIEKSEEEQVAEQIDEKE